MARGCGGGPRSRWVRAAGVLAGEILAFGRQARGETLTTASSMTVGRLPRWQAALVGHLSCGGYRPHGDAGPSGSARRGAGERHAGACRRGSRGSTCLGARQAGAANNAMRAAATIVNNVLLVRWLADDASDIRPSFAALWMGLRATCPWPTANPPLSGMPEGSSPCA